MRVQKFPGDGEGFQRIIILQGEGVREFKKLELNILGGRAGYGDPLLDLRMSILSKYCFVIRHSLSSPGQTPKRRHQMGSRSVYDTWFLLHFFPI